MHKLWVIMDRAYSFYTQSTLNLLTTLSYFLLLVLR